MKREMEYTRKMPTKMKVKIHFIGITEKVFWADTQTPYTVYSGIDAMQF